MLSLTKTTQVCLSVCVWQRPRGENDSRSPATIYDEMAGNKQHEMKTDTTRAGLQHREPLIHSRRSTWDISRSTHTIVSLICLSSFVSVNHLFLDTPILATWDRLAVTSHRCSPTHQWYFSPRYADLGEGHRRRLHRPHGQKVVGAMTPSRPTGILLCQFFWNSKM